MLRDVKLSPFHCRVFPADEVESRHTEAEVDPRAAELERDDVEAIWKAVRLLYGTGMHPAISLCIRRRGHIVLERALGHISGNAPGDRKDAPKVPVRHDSLFNLFSAAKSVTAMMAHLLEDQRLLHLDDPVCEYFPEFGACGKQAVTIRQILTHRAGVPALRDVAMNLELIVDRERMLRHLSEQKPLSVPGRDLAYHAITGGYIIDELVRRLTGGNIDALLEKHVRRPLGMKSLRYGVRRDEVPLVAQNAFTGMPPMPPVSTFVKRCFGVTVREAVDISNAPSFLTAVIPSGNLICTAEEGARFFELLLRGGELDGQRIFDRRTVHRAVAETSYLEIDSFLGFPVRYGSGFMLGGKLLSLYGPDTPHAFGHIGFSNVVCWADPDRDLSACLMTSGKPLITPGQVMWWNVMRTIASRVSKVAPRPFAS
jgi:CubicO group peptidase (beta-lactamase class C family)